MSWALTTLVVTLAIVCPHARCAARLGDERIIFQTRFGNLELALYPEVRSMSLCRPLSCLFPKLMTRIMNFS